MDCCKNLKNLVNNITDCQIIGTLDIDITGMTHDSRKCSHGYIFFAIHGIHYNGHAYINSAIDNGALVIIYSEPLSQYLDGVTYIQTASVYESISRVSSIYYNNPSRVLKVIGVTGTDGKTSTCDYIYQLLILANRNTSLLSSVWQDNGTGKVRNLKHMTTPDAIEVHKFLHESVNNGCEFAVVEASSHGLSNDLKRLADVSFTIGICTNITSDHLDFHKTRSSYIDAKMNLFRQLRKNTGIAVIPHDADWVNSVKKIINNNSKIYTWCILEKGKNVVNEATYSISIDEKDTSGISISLQSDRKQLKIKTPFPFPVQISNFAPALITLVLLSDNTSILHSRIFEKIKPIPGRFNIMERERAAMIILDFAHTENAFFTLFTNVRCMYPHKNFIAVFGSAGCRDTFKREHLGRIASNFCNTIVLTDDDPREEDSLMIIHDIQSGIPENFPGTIVIQPDRKKAIKTALQIAKEEDLIFCLGKGLETSIEKNGILFPWDEEQTILELCKTQGVT